jgi:hypothetical protein
MSNFEIKWHAPEFDFREKDISWYWISIIIAVLLVGAAIWQKNFLFGFFVVVAEILVISWANQEPPLVEFTLNENGVGIGPQKIYAFSEMESFAVDEKSDNEWPPAYFQFRRKLKIPLKIRVPKDRREEIKKALAQVLTQIEFQQSLLDTVEELVKF